MTPFLGAWSRTSKSARCHMLASVFLDAPGTGETMTESRMIEIPAAGDSGTSVPLTTITGARPGPVLALIAGNHGYEYPPILALQKLRGGIDAAELAGTVMMVHVANMPSFLGRTVYF